MTGQFLDLFGCPDLLRCHGNPSSSSSPNSSLFLSGPIKSFVLEKYQQKKKGEKIHTSIERPFSKIS